MSQLDVKPDVYSADYSGLLAGATAVSLAPSRLLLVVNEVEASFLVELISQPQRPFNIILTHQTNEALHLLRTSHFDAILTCETSAIPLLNAITPEPIKKPVIVLLQTNKIERVIEIMKCGALDCIPISQVTREKLLAALAEAERLTQQHYQQTINEDHLQTYAAELEARNHELDAFAGMVAHDLKNVFTQVRASADLIRLKYGRFLSTDILKHIHRINTSTQKGGEIIQALLVLSNISSSQPHFEPLNMPQIINNAISQLDHLSQNTGAEFQLPSEWPSIWSYRPWIEEIWVNYLSNAIKYGGTPPIIQVGWETKNNFVRFWVKDNGPGLGGREQKQLFQPFQRLQSNLTEGHGLGLFIVKQIVSRLEGEVNVQSTPGGGTIFDFSLPVIPLDDITRKEEHDDE